MMTCFEKVLLMVVLINGISCIYSLHNLHRFKTSRYISSVYMTATDSSTPSAPAKTINIASDNTESLNKVRFLESLWKGISFPSDIPAEGQEFRLKDFALTRRSIQPVISHFQTCKDCAGEDAVLVATQDDEKNDMLVLSCGGFKILSDNPEDDDEVWEDLDESLFGPVEGENELPVFRDEKDDEKVLDISKMWVKKVIADFNVCPFTMDPNKAGIPPGGVRYTISRAKTAEEAFYRYWEEVKVLLTTPEKQISTTLLIFPEIELFGNFELFESYCESLSDGLSCNTLGLEDQLQLVFFHPKYQFRDGQARINEEHGSANYARRSPWPMVNILRTPQVRAAQKGIPTGLVYKQNEERLTTVGGKNLQEMLNKCDWSTLPAINANVKLEQISIAMEKSRQLRQQEEEESGSLIAAGSDVAVSAPAVCPFHPEASTKEQTEVEEIGTIMEATQSVEDMLSVNVEEPESLEAFLRLIESTTEGNPSGNQRSAIQTADESSSESLSEEDLLRLADEVDRWINAADDERA